MRRRWIVLVSGIFFVGFFQNCGEMGGLQTAEQLDLASLSDPKINSKIDESKLTNFNGNLISDTKSLMILDRNILNNLGNEFDLGLLIGRFGQHQQGYKPANRATPPGQYLDRTFRIMAQQQEDEAAYYAANPNANGKNEPVPLNRRMDVVLDLWNKKRASEGRTDLFNVTDINDLRGGPFRLLAIANRMDLAGDYDPRTQDEITTDPRSLGELHLLYGLVDPEYERVNQKPFPMVLAIKYRLPVLNRSGSTYSIDDSPLVHRSVVETYDLLKAGRTADYAAHPLNWNEKMHLWAHLWAGLSNLNTSDAAFIRRLRDILNLSTRAQDLLALEANTQILENEFEINAWYLFMGNRFLIPRSLRREPFRCMGGSTELAEMVNKFWVPEYNDLDMTSRNFALGPDGRRDEDKAGYEVLRDNYRTFLSDKVTDNPLIPEWNKKIWNSGSCGDQNHLMPFRMKRSDDNENSAGRIFMITEATRIRGNGPLWGLGALKNVPNRESRRHAFAIRTCSGCHSQEGATRGFHVSPRLPNEESKMSAFLTGKRQSLAAYFVNPIPNNTFTFGTNNRVYEYDELLMRKDWLHKSLTRTAVLYESLKRPELKP